MWTKYDKGKIYCVFDVDTRPATPSVVLEIYRAAEGLVERKAFTWDEVLGLARIKVTPPPAAKPATGGTNKPPAQSGK